MKRPRRSNRKIVAELAPRMAVAFIAGVGYAAAPFVLAWQAALWLVAFVVMAAFGDRWNWGDR